MRLFSKRFWLILKHLTSEINCKSLTLELQRSPILEGRDNVCCSRIKNEYETVNIMKITDRFKTFFDNRQDFDVSVVILSAGKNVTCLHNERIWSFPTIFYSKAIQHCLGLRLKTPRRAMEQIPMILYGGGQCRYKVYFRYRRLVVASVLAVKLLIYRYYQVTKHCTRSKV